MKRICVTATLAVGLACAVGCGEDNPNKNLKPLDPATAKPIKAAGEGGGGNELKPGGVAK